MTDIELRTFFQKIEDELNEAYERNDIGKITELLSDRWIILESSTGLSSKKQFAKALADGTLVQTKMKKEVQEVNQFESITIVISRGKHEGQYLGKTYNSEQWVTNIYIKEKDNWVCIMTQEVAVARDIK